MKNILAKLSAIQAELKAPKGQYNSYGGFAYRSCEDILEAVKPLCQKHGCVLTIGDELIYQGDRYHVKATATLYDIESEEHIENTALAREAETKKGMDDSQITGTASSYARKYALNGLFCIDDTKDADTDEYKKAADGRTNNSPAPQQQNSPAPQQQNSPPPQRQQKCTCVKCGKVIKKYKGKDGVVYTPEQFAQKSDGLCLDCFKGKQ